MNETNKTPQSKNLASLVCSVLVVVGNFLALAGCLAIALGLTGIYNLDVFSFGLSSGIRMVGTVAIAGCLLSAIGYGFSDLFIN